MHVPEDLDLETGGLYQWRRSGEFHAINPEVVAKLQHAVRGNSQDHYRAFAKIINDQSEHLLTIRGLFTIKTAEQAGRKPVPLDDMVKRYA